MPPTASPSSGWASATTLTLKRCGSPAPPLRKARDLRVGAYATVIHGAGAGGLDSGLAARTVVEASLLGLYTYYHYKTPPEDPRPVITEITIVERDDARADAFERAVDEAGKLVAGVNLARDLSQAPAT